jgi:cytochrome c5
MSRASALSASERRFLGHHAFDNGRGMILSPRVTRRYEGAQGSPLWPLARHVTTNRTGLMAGEQGKGFMGLHTVTHQGTKVAVFGCAVCHAGKAAGAFVPGLGNKNFDVHAGGELLWEQLTRDRRDLAAGRLSGTERQTVEAAMHFASVLKQDEFANDTQGLVPTTIVWNWLYQNAGKELPKTMRVPMQVKVPHLWGYATKREAGLFCDGISDGSKPGWLMAVPMTAGHPPASVRKDLGEIRALEQVFARLMPPAYPFPVKTEEVRSGKAVYIVNCRECHGSYERRHDGTPDYRQPKWVGIEDVGTDSQRLLIDHPLTREAALRAPLADLMRTSSVRQGYLAPRLDGIWARFPYLHNGSVPNIHALLTPPQMRPRVFSLKRAGERERFDEERLGLTLPDAHEEEALLRRGAKADRTVYDTRRTGHSNAGHAFGTTLSDADKRHLIEYLKTL